ncbi:MAG: nucleoside-diphosphate sugar epimerase/dehydratase [bacterium]|nr:nucleoside-diphosphate sugar epimerase/dehydratase [bacterium]
MFKTKQYLSLISDGIMVGVILYLAFWVRFGGIFTGDEYDQFFTILPVFILVRLISFYFFGLYKGIWRYASLQDLLNIIKAVTISMIILVVITFFFRFSFPRTIFPIDWAFTILFIGGKKFLPRILREFKRQKTVKKRVLIAGAGDAGEMIAREIKNSFDSEYTVIGFIDDHHQKQGMQIQGIKVLGKKESIPYWVKRKKIEEVIIAMPSVPGKVIYNIVSICKDSGVRCKAIPSLSELIRGQVSIKELRDINPDDLLRRAPVTLNLEEISAYLDKKCILVTGAAGSIGSELCREILNFNPERLIMFDHNENDLFFLENELKGEKEGRDNSFALEVCIGDIKDRQKVNWVMERFAPKVIFHAAAHKHVPMMELNPEEAIKNNIGGTKILAELAIRYKVEKFIYISTDKAVNPISVMGASKRVGEMLIQNVNGDGQTQFISVRFGNVLGSAGSVIPLFRKQIEEGGPLTVTHPEATRYFMTAPEAVSLVIQAGAMGKGGEVFVLDMGEPVKITDLAKDLIMLSGLELNKDIEIKFIGLRPGEKLHEELLTMGETTSATYHKQIFIAKPDLLDPRILEEKINNLVLTSEQGDREGIIQQLKEFVPDYNPNSNYG